MAIKHSPNYGGKRPNAGRQPKFQSDDTTGTIRVPRKHIEAYKRISLLIDSLVSEGFSIEEIEALIRKADRGA